MAQECAPLESGFSPKEALNMKYWFIPIYENLKLIL